MPRKRQPQTETQPTTVQLGLAAALGEGSTTKPEPRLVPLAQLAGRITTPDPTRYDKKAWADFLQSVQERGLDVPVLIRVTGGGYDIVEGRHRTLAIEQLRLGDVPCLARSDYDDAGAALAEVATNTQRSQGGNPYNEALALRRAMDAGKLTGEAAARKVGRSAAWVHERLRLLKLAEAGGEKLVRRVGSDIDGDDLAPAFDLLKMPEDAPNRAQLVTTALEAAGNAKRADRYGIEQTICQALEKQGAAVLGYDFADYEVREDPAFKRAIAKVPGFSMGRSGAKIVFDRPAAVRAREDAVARLRVKDNARSKTGKKVDVDGMVLRRLGAIQAELASKKIKGLVAGITKDMERTLVLEWLRNLGMIGSRNVDRQLMKDAGGVDKWDGRGEGLVSHVDKAWGKVGAAKILHVALFLAKDRRQVWQSGKGVPDPYAQLVLGRSNAAVVAQAKREVAVDLKAKTANSAKAKKVGAKASKKAKADDEPTAAELAQEHADLDDEGTGARAAAEATDTEDEDLDGDEDGDTQE